MKHLRRLGYGASILAAVFVLVAASWRAYEAATMVRPGIRADVPSYAGPGPHDVGARNATIGGAASLPVTVWYPTPDDGRGTVRSSYAYQLKWFVRLGGVARVAGNARWDAPIDRTAARPLVVLSPGFTMGRTAYAWLAERLASHGFVVVAPEHDEVMTEALDDFWRAAVTRPRDVRAVLDWVAREAGAGGRLQGAVDPERVAVVGHSLGGYTALAVAGARLDLAATAELCERARLEAHPNAWLCDLLVDHAPEMAALAGLASAPAGPWPSWGDGRVDAVVSMAGDAFPFGAAGLAHVRVPVLALGGTRDSGTPYAWGTGPTYDQVGAARAARAAFEGAEHMVFSASCEAVPFLRLVGRTTLCGDATWDVQRAHDAAAHLTVAFLLAELAGDAAAAASLAPPAVRIPGVAYDARGY